MITSVNNQVIFRALKKGIQKTLGKLLHKHTDSRSFDCRQHFKQVQSSQVVAILFSICNEMHLLFGKPTYSNSFQNVLFNFTFGKTLQKFDSFSLIKFSKSARSNMKIQIRHKKKQNEKTKIFKS